MSSYDTQHRYVNISNIYNNKFLKRIPINELKQQLILNANIGWEWKEDIINNNTDEFCYIPKINLPRPKAPR